MSRRSRSSALVNPEVTFHVFEVLAGGDGARGIDGVLADAGQDDVDPVEVGLGVYLLLIAAEGERGISDLAEEMLADLAFIDDLPDSLPDCPRAFQPAGCCDPGPDRMSGQSHHRDDCLKQPGPPAAPVTRTVLAAHTRTGMRGRPCPGPPGRAAGPDRPPVRLPPLRYHGAASGHGAPSVPRRKFAEYF